MNEMRVEQTVGLTRKLADFACSFTLESVPEAAIAHAKLAILDCIGVSVLALSQEIGCAMLTFARQNAGAGTCTVWGADIATNARDAAFCNGILSHGLDFDDRNHSSTFTLAAAWSASEDRGRTGRQLLEAFIVGREVRNSLDKLFSDRNSGVGPGAKGWHSNGVLGAIAAACSAGKALELDRAKLLAAIGLAAGSCGALTRDGGTMAKPFRTGHAAATGLTCALLAESGFSADETVLEGRHGLLDALSPIPDAALQALGKDLGVRFQLENPIRSKPLASCTATHSTTEAMLRLREKNAIRWSDVAEIHCDLKPYPLVRQIPKRGFEGRFSMPFCLAMALAYGRLNPDDFTDAHVSNPDIQAVMQRVSHVPKSTVLTVVLSNGMRLSEDLCPPSDFTSQEDIVRKFHRCVSDVFSNSMAAEVVDQIQTLEALPSVRSLSNIVAATKPVLQTGAKRPS